MASQCSWFSHCNILTCQYKTKEPDSPVHTTKSFKLRKLGGDVMIVKISVTASLSMPVHRLNYLTKFSAELEFRKIRDLNSPLVKRKGHY